MIYLGKKLYEAMERNRFSEYLLNHDVGRQEELMMLIQ